MDGLDRLNEHLFSAIESVRNKSMEIDEAKTIAELGKVIVQGMRTRVDAVKLVETSFRNPHRVLGVIEQSGILPRPQLENKSKV